jgi:membrane fusion protein (multidrug efflux system)
VKSVIGPCDAIKSPACRAGPYRPFAHWLRVELCLILLSLALIAGAYCYLTGGDVMSTDDGYVEAEEVGVSTDVSGIGKEIDVSENQRVDAGQVLYLLTRSSVRASCWMR